MKGRKEGLVEIKRKSKVVGGEEDEKKRGTEGKRGREERQEERKNIEGEEKRREKEKRA